MKLVTRVVLFTVIIAMLSGLSLTVPVQAQVNQDEARIVSTSNNIDRDATAAKGQTVQLQALAKEFNVSTGLIEDLRAQKQGWGEVTIGLAIAQHLSQTDPKAYPTLTDALTKIESLRADKIGWGKIAQDLGFKLGPVISAVEQARHELVRNLHSERPQPIEKAERHERPNTPMRPELPDRFEHPHR